jgi:hypothetical protein
MNYNSVLSVIDISDGSATISEPVTLQEMKDYLRLEGFVDVDESTSFNISDFDFDDQLITDMIKSSRELIEEKAGISIIQKTLEAVITNLCGMIEIPYGPVNSIASLKDELNNDVEYTMVGNSWRWLKTPCYKNMKMVYEAGYVNLPTPIKIDVMRLCAYMYENRGDDPAVDKFASQLSVKYSRNTVII